MKPAIAVHGGAGEVDPEDDAQALQAGCLAAARAGYALLARGGSALDAVEAAARVLEDNPLYNAGTGSVLNAEGAAEMDASLMEGDGQRAGAVAAVQGIPNPIRLARAVMDRTPHVLLVGEGAHRLAAEAGVPTCDPQRLVTPRARERWQRSQAPKHGTIGVVAIDSAGTVAAATSTGGTGGKRPGRVGDSPLIGSGTYADNRTGAASCTGHGEGIIRAVLAKTACDLLREGHPPHPAAALALRELARLQADGGLILIDRAGRVGFAFNTERMSRAWIDGEGIEATGFR